LVAKDSDNTEILGDLFMVQIKKNLIAVLFVALSLNGVASSYTQEEIQRMRTASSLVSLLVDAGCAVMQSTDQSLVDQQHLSSLAQQDLLKNLRACPRTINEVLSAALEKDESFCCLQLLTIIAHLSKRGLLESEDQYQQRVAKEILTPLLPKLINTLLYAVVKKIFPGPRYAIARRALRVVIATATRTITQVAMDRLIPSSWALNVSYGQGRLSGEIQRPREWSDVDIMFQTGINLLEIATVEVLGAIIAGGIQKETEKKAPAEQHPSA
jgi:hypothetical protein